MKYRDKTEIIQDILQTANSDGNGIGKTKIMRNASLSSYQIRAYLSILIDNGLIQLDLNSPRLKITEKGLKFLQLYEQIGDLLEVEER
jgi:predicted transcriptional regulator